MGRLGEVASCEKIWNMMQTFAKVDDDHDRILAGATALAPFGTSMMTNSLQEQEGGTNRPYCFSGTSIRLLSIGFDQ